MQAINVKLGLLRAIVEGKVIVIQSEIVLSKLLGDQQTR